MTVIGGVRGRVRRACTATFATPGDGECNFFYGTLTVARGGVGWRFATPCTTPRLVRPVVSKEPCHGDCEGAGDEVGLVGVHGPHAVLDAPDGVAAEVGAFGEAWLPQVAPLAQTADAAPDLQAVGHEPGFVVREHS